MKSQKFRETDVWFQISADAQVKSYFVQTTSPTLRHDIFRVKGQANRGRFQSMACLQLAGQGIHQQQSKTRSSPADTGRTWICAPTQKQVHACVHTHQNKPVLPCLLGRLQLQYLKPEISFKPFGPIRTLSAVALPASFLSQLPARKIPPHPPFPAHTTQKAKTDPSLPLQLGFISQNTHM